MASIDERLGAVDDCLVELWADFSFQLYVRSGWLRRRVDKWSYSSGSEWLCDISFALEQGTLQEYWEKRFAASARELIKRLKDDSKLAHARQEMSDEELEELLDGIRERKRMHLSTPKCTLPLVLVEKGVNFVAFDLEDNAGESMQLMLKSQAAQMCLSILIGAVENKVKEDGFVFPAIKSTDLLARVLWEWFQHDYIPKRPSGAAIDIADSDRDAALKLAFLEEVEKYGSTYGWSDAEKRLVAGEFIAFYDDMSIFSNIFKTFTYKQLICVTVDICEECNSIIKCRYQVPNDLPSKRAAGVHRREMGRSPLVGMVVPFELDNIQCSESSHTIIEAPEGLRFAANKVPANATTYKKPDANHMYYIIDTPLFASDFSPDSDELGYTVEARGSLSPKHVSCESAYPWATGELDRIRHVPIGKSVDHRCILALRLIPEIRPRVPMQFMLLVFSLIFFVMCCLVPPVTHDGGLSLESLLILLPVALTVISIRDEPNYLRKKMLGIPNRITYTGIALDTVGFLTFYVAGALSKCGVVNDVLSGLVLDASFVSTLAFAGALLCLVLLIALGIWWASVLHGEKVELDQYGDACVFDIPVAYVGWGSSQSGSAFK